MKKQINQLKIIIKKDKKNKKIKKNHPKKNQIILKEEMFLYGWNYLKYI